MAKPATAQTLCDQILIWVKHIATPYLTANLMLTALALLFHKIHYTYKLCECLLSQVSYYEGSFKLAVDRDNDFEYHMYLIQMHPRMHLHHTDCLHIFKALKAMVHNITNVTSPLPWNNQFSFYGYDEFGVFGLQQMPIFGINYIEHKLVDILHLDVDRKKWRGLCTLLG